MFQNSSSASSCRKDCAKKVHSSKVVYSYGNRWNNCRYLNKKGFVVILLFIFFPGSRLKTKLIDFIEVNEKLFYTYMKNWFLHR